MLWRLSTSASWIKMLSHSHFVELFRQIFIDFHPNYVVQCVGGDVLITQIILLMFHLSLSILFLPFELGHTSQCIDNRTNQPIDLLRINNQYCSPLWMQKTQDAKQKHFCAHYIFVKLLNSCGLQIVAHLFLSSTFQFLMLS